jgi:hypothetical protein
MDGSKGGAVRERERGEGKPHRRQRRGGRGGGGPTMEGWGRGGGGWRRLDTMWEERVTVAKP